MANLALKTLRADKWVIFIQWAIALEWLKSGWGKFAKPDFMNGIAKSMNGFAAKTPHDWYADFLRNTVIPNAEMFGNLVRWGEILMGSALVVGGLWLLIKQVQKKLAGAVVLFALVCGVLLNLNFYYAAGWSSPSTEGINIVMGLVQFVLAAYYVRWLSRVARAK